MLLDLFNVFSDGQVVSATTVYSTNVFDTGQVIPDLGTGENLYVVVQADTTVSDSSGTDAVVTVNLVWDADSALGSVSATKQVIGTFAHGDVAGTTLIARIQPGYPAERYVGIQFVTADGDLDATSTFSAFLTHGIDKWKAYPNSSKASIDTD
jgi:hypothetical protein